MAFVVQYIFLSGFGKIASDILCEKSNVMLLESKVLLDRILWPGYHEIMVFCHHLMAVGHETARDWLTLFGCNQIVSLLVRLVLNGLIGHATRSTVAKF